MKEICHKRQAMKELINIHRYGTGKKCRRLKTYLPQRMLMFHSGADT